MFELPKLTIRIEAAARDALQDILAQSGKTDTIGTTKELFGPNTEFLVARLDGRPVGCIALLDHVTYGEARRLYVVEDMRGQGIAAELVTALEREARDIGLKSLRLHAEAAGASRKTALEGFGFRAAKGGNTAWLEKHL